MFYTVKAKMHKTTLVNGQYPVVTQWNYTTKSPLTEAQVRKLQKQFLTQSVNKGLDYFEARPVS